jgi:flagellar biosynthesis protein
MNKPSDPSAPSDPQATIAVALEEQPDNTAPIITASGKGFVAEQILQIAFANNVKVRTDADLVQVLSAVDVDSEIPTEAFAAVSEILAYVYKANGQTPPPPFTSSQTNPSQSKSGQK